MRLACVFLFCLGTAGSVLAAERLKIVYFHDEDRSSLQIRDLAFLDPERGMAVGALADSRGGKPKGVGLVTTDAGHTWTMIRLPAPAAWLFLDARAGWIGGNGRVWKTHDFGQTWKRVGKLDGVSRVFFVDAQRGWAVGARKSIFETGDGGEHWRPLPAAEQFKTTRDITVFNCIAFADAKHGFITGSARPPRRGMSPRLADWLDPESREREWPSTMLLLATRDGGQTWQESVTSVFGQVTRLRLAADGRGMALIEFRGEFPFPSEVIAMDLRTGSSQRVFRSKDRSVTDIALAGEVTWLAAVEPPGRLLRSPVPGKLKLLRSTDLSNWTEIDVDYRAVAGRAVCVLAGSTLWVGTDTGMLLRLEKE